MNNRIRIVERPNLTDAELNGLFKTSWNEHAVREFGPILRRSLTYFAAYDETRLVGFVNVAWDGGDHAFLLDPTVAPECRHRGIGLALVEAAARVSKAGGAKWLHVDYEPGLECFYAKAGFRATHAGLIPLSTGE
jgi:ribosomal protein S18 acetylase RimI-like enzyme